MFLQLLRCIPPLNASPRVRREWGQNAAPASSDPADGSPSASPFSGGSLSVYRVSCSAFKGSASCELLACAPEGDATPGGAGQLVCNGIQVVVGWQQSW